MGSHRRAPSGSLTGCRRSSTTPVAKRELADTLRTVGKIVLGLIVVCGLLVVACSASTPCSAGCTAASSATFLMSCNPNDLVAITTNGPCTNSDAGLSWYTGAETKWAAAVFAASPGTCHVVLTFATGFTYSADVTFTEQSQSCGCPSYVGPNGPGGFQVNNPPDTCAAIADAAGGG
jgi:hypothetical protein